MCWPVYGRPVRYLGFNDRELHWPMPEKELQQRWRDKLFDLSCGKIRQRDRACQR